MVAPLPTLQMIRDWAFASRASTSPGASAIWWPVTSSWPSARAMYSTTESARSRRRTCRRSNGIASRTIVASRGTSSSSEVASAARRATAVSTAEPSIGSMRRTQYNPHLYVNTLAPGLSWVDLLFLGWPHAVATVVVSGGSTLALIDPGPTTCLETLDAGLQAQGLRLSDVTHLLLTHIHLDHAGATGTLV